MTRRLSRELRRELQGVVDDAFDLLDRGELERARNACVRAVELAPDHRDVRLLLADLAMAEDDLDAAYRQLEQALLQAPDDAEAHERMMRWHERRGDERSQVHHAMALLALDARADRRRGVGSRTELAFIEGQVHEVLDALPPSLADRVSGVPIVLEPRPSFDLVLQGFDPRALGLFDGLTDFDHHSTEPAPRPTRIVLYFANLLAICTDEESLAEQVEITVLHELGHFFGLDEGAVEALGLA